MVSVRAKARRGAELSERLWPPIRDRLLSSFTIMHCATAQRRADAAAMLGSQGFACVQVRKAKVVRMSLGAIGQKASSTVLSRHVYQGVGILEPEHERSKPLWAFCSVEQYLGCKEI